MKILLIALFMGVLTLYVLGCTMPVIQDENPIEQEGWEVLIYPKEVTP